MAKTFRVNFEPEGREITVAEGTTILEAAIRAKARLNAPCGGKGTCGGCKVQIPENPPSVNEAERRQLTGEEIHRNLRLACQVRITSDMRVVVPEESRFRDQQILETGIERKVPVAPQVSKIHLNLTEPSIADQLADSERLVDAVAMQRPDNPARQIDLHLIRELAERMRKFHYNLTATVVGNQIVQVERGDTSEALYGIAFDIGTTTVVGMLVDLVSGQQLAVASRTNPQATYGDDVLARIEYGDRNAGGLKRLHKIIVDCLNEIIEEVSAAIAIKPTSIYEAVAVGNTTMTHLLLRLPVSNIGRAPYIAALRGGVTVCPRDIGLKINSRGQIYAAPNISGFLGADTTSVILASNIHKTDKLSLAIDIGTNGEIVLGNSQRLIACSTAAGPAFEGARIQYGMRASTGAIDRVDIVDDKLHLHTIHDAPPVGLCGTGLIDAVAELLRVGIIQPNGAFCCCAPPETQYPPGSLQQRLQWKENGCGFMLASGDEPGSPHPIYLTQKDIREVQLAKGAIFAGIQLLKQEMGVTDADIEQVLLAGAFGNYIRAERAASVGLLPHVDLNRVVFVGNAAGTGAKLLLINRHLRDEAEEISRGVETVELASRPDFQQQFADAMMFPEPARTG